jgi:2,3-dihydroxybenzoate-AMP ligase
MLAGCVRRPAGQIAAYHEQGYWRDVTLPGLLRDWAEAEGDRIALTTGNREVSYAELDRWADELAAGLHARGIAAGDRVIVQLPNIPEFVALFFALLRLGACPVFALPAHRWNEIRHLCEISEAVAYVIPDVFFGFDYRGLAADVLDGLPSVRHVFVAGDAGPFTSLASVAAEPTAGPPPREPASPDDTAFFMLSGGTTALPKLIPRTHAEYDYMTRAAGAICQLAKDTVYLAVLPVAFNFPWGAPGILGTFQAGGKVVLSAAPDPGTCFALIERERVSITALVPTLAQVWIDAVGSTGHDLSSLRLLQIGGAKLHQALANRVQPELGCALQQVYGMTEGLLCFTRLDDPPQYAAQTGGRPMSPADELRVVDERGREVPPGGLGELQARGPCVLAGYYRAPEHNSHAFTADGYYRTGDLIRLRADGYLCVEGRVKDVIIRGGDKISAAEVEEHLAALPGIREAAVIPVPDELLGEQILACVVPAGAPPSVREVKDLLRRRGLAEFKLPDRLRVVDALPLTALGKIDKKALATQPA